MALEFFRHKTLKDLGILVLCSPYTFQPAQREDVIDTENM